MQNFLLTLLLWSSSLMCAPFTIMLDPAGDAEFTGRHLDDNFERGITLQCVESLKKELESRRNDIVVVITRFPGETIQPLQNANFANRLHVDLYISFHFYHEERIKPDLFVFRYTTTSQKLPLSPSQQLSFCSLDQAHRLSSQATQIDTNVAKKALSSPLYQSLFEVKGIFNLPFKPIMGITSPAFAIEMGLKKKDDWHFYIDAFAEMITSIVKAQQA